MPQKRELDVVPGEEVRSSIRFQMDRPRDTADYIIIPSLEAVFDEDAIQEAWGEGDKVKKTFFKSADNSEH